VFRHAKNIVRYVVDQLHQPGSDVLRTDMLDSLALVLQSDAAQFLRENLHFALSYLILKKDQVRLAAVAALLESDIPLLILNDKLRVEDACMLEHILTAMLVECPYNDMAAVFQFLEANTKLSISNLFLLYPNKILFRIIVETGSNSGHLERCLRLTVANCKNVLHSSLSDSAFRDFFQPDMALSGLSK
jgi:hypothetical protein